MYTLVGSKNEKKSWNSEKECKHSDAILMFREGVCVCLNFCVIDYDMQHEHAIN